MARCFLRGCKVIVLDEPTAALDGENEVSWISMVLSYRDGLLQTRVRDALNALVAESSTTVILASHRLSTVANANNIFVLDDGRIVETGTSPQLLKKKGVYYNLMKNQLM